MLTFHTILGFIALGSGAWNLITKKGTNQHRMMGSIYVGSMILLIVSSFWIFELFDGFGPYHAMSLISGATVILAIYFPLRRHKHKNWLEHHYMWISWSYVGLVMATGSHLFEYGPAGWPYWSLILLYWGLPCFIGAILIYGNRKRLLTQFSSTELPTDKA